MQCEITIYEILQSNSTNEQKADAICSIMIWPKKDVLDQLSTTNGDSEDDRHRFIDRFWPKSTARRR